MKLKILLLVLSIFGVGVALCRASDNSNFDSLYSKYKNLSGEELSEQGKGFMSRNSVDSALAVYTIMAIRYENPRTEEDRNYACQAHNCLGMICFLNSNYSGAYSHFTIASELRNEDDSAGNLNLSAIYLYYGDKRKAYQIMRKVFDAAVRNKNYHIASSTLLNLLSSDIDDNVFPQDSIAQLIKFYRKNVKRTSDNPEYNLAAHMASAKLLSIEGKFDDAIAELQKSLQDTRTTLMPIRNSISSYEEIGKIYHAAGKMDSSVYYLTKAIDTAREYNYPELLLSAYSNLSEIYADSGQKALADEYRYKHLDLNDSLFSSREFGEIHDLEMFHQADKFERNLNRLTMEKEANKKVTIIVSFALILLTALLIYIFRKNSILRRKNKSLFEWNLKVMAAQTQLPSKIVSEAPHTEVTREILSDDIASAENIGNIEIPEDSEISDNDNNEESYESKKAKYHNSGLSEEMATDIENNIRKVMSCEENFCGEDFSLHKLAVLCESNSKYVSQVINERFGMGFSQYLNECRVSVARRRFMDFENYGHLTIEAIVAQLGYKSRSTFSKTFKRITGLTPTEFQRMARDKKSPAE